MLEFGDSSPERGINQHSGNQGQLDKLAMLCMQSAKIAFVELCMHTATQPSDSDLVRQHAADNYISAARRRGDRTFSISVGTIHRALALNNRVPLVCAALGSKKFLTENRLRLVSKTGPPSGQSTTVTYTYEFEDDGRNRATNADPFLQLRGIGKDIFASLGGGEAFLREERANFNPSRRRESTTRR